MGDVQGCPSPLETSHIARSSRALAPLADRERSVFVKQFSSGKPDNAFGQVILTLRTAIGLTQIELAKRLGVSRKAVGAWEAGGSYPKAEHLKELITLGMQHHAFPGGHEAQEIRALWQASHQKMLLDEQWLSSLLQQPSPPPELVPVEETDGDEDGSAPPPASPNDRARAAQSGQRPLSLEPFGNRAPASYRPRVDWGDALDVPSFYGRERELDIIAQWAVQERCRVVSVLGMGGIGKSALVIHAMRALVEHFEVVLFRSLRDAPSCETLLESCLQVLCPEALVQGSQGLSARQRLLLEQLRSTRVLLVLDNLESLLHAGDLKGRLRPGFEAYDHLLRQMAESGHHSCLLLTSREKPNALRGLEGSHLPVRTLRLEGLEASACELLLASHKLVGSPEERERLVEHYGGNPLALNIVAQTITDLFEGEMSSFLQADTTIFGGITELLSEQWGRLSPLEQTVLCWLATLREPVTLEELLSVLVTRLSPTQLLEAMDGLRRRSLIERGQRAGSFTLQSVVLEYVTDRLVTMASYEIQQGQLRLLREHGLSQAQAKEYVRQTQERLLLTPLLDLLKSMYQGRAEMEERLRELLSTLRALAEQAQGYGPANLATLLRLLRGDLRRLDLSQLAIRGAYLQGVEMQDATLAGALIQQCVFTETFDAPWAVAISRSGQYWAIANKRGEVRVWREAGKILHLAWRAHTDHTWGLAFSPDERLLASASLDDSVKLWQVESGALLWSGEHPGAICLAFAPDGGLLASGGSDGSVRIWDPKLDIPLEQLPHPDLVLVLAWSPDGNRLATGGLDRQIRIWEIGHSRSATCVQTLEAHTHWVRALAFAPDGRTLASGSWDGTVKLWLVGEEGSLRVRQTLMGHMDRVQCLAWSADGATLASSSFDHTIRLWDVKQGTSRGVLQGHSDAVHSLAFDPKSHYLLSGSEDGSLRLWDVERGEALRVLKGYAAALYDVAWSPDGTQLASVGSDTQMCIWEMTGRGEGMLRRRLDGHEWSVYGVGWRPDGKLVASSGWDNAIRLWEPTTGTCLQVIRIPEGSVHFFGLAWSPDGKQLASGTYQQGVLLWDMMTSIARWLDCEQPTWIHRVVWSADGTRVVGGGDDGHVYVWDAKSGTLLQRLAGHQGAVMSLAWSPDGTQLASAGGSRDRGEIFVWDGHSGERLYAREGFAEVISTVAWHPAGDQLISGDSDGRLRWWDLPHEACVRVQEAHQGTVYALKVSLDGRRLVSCGDDGAIQIWDVESGEHICTLRRDRPYERLNIPGIRGLTQAEIATLRALGAVEEGINTL
jgi:WD40 repeat protein/transcriptional regulator with XRE-family HTH domain